MKRICTISFFVVLTMFLICANVLADGGADQAVKDTTEELRKAEEKAELAEKAEPSEEGFRLEIEEIPLVDPALDWVEEVNPIWVEMGFDVVSAYMWRGQNLGDDASFQPYVTPGISLGNFGDLSFTYWANITADMPGKDNTEYDFVTDYTVNVKSLSEELFQYDSESASTLTNTLLDFDFSTGWIYYYFPPDSSDSHEFYWVTTWNTFLNPSFSIYYDFDSGDGQFYQWGLSQDVDLGIFTLNLMWNIGLNQHQWIEGTKGANTEFGGSIPFKLGKHMTIEPYLRYSKKLTDDPAFDDELYGGFNFNISF